jgi:hypothetical protein
MYDDQYIKIEAMFAKVVIDYKGHHKDILALISACREAITSAQGKLGPWETQDLDYAESAVKANMLRLALLCAEKALDVSQLPKEEYEIGFNYGKKTR